MLWCGMTPLVGATTRDPGHQTNMYIQTNKDSLVSIRNEHTNGERVVFSDTNTAQVTEEIGEQLVSEYDSMEVETE